LNIVILKVNLDRMKQLRTFKEHQINEAATKFFEITYSNKWVYDDPKFIHGDNHKDAIEKIDKKTKRISNKRFREIEKTGQFYFVVDQSKNGKSIIFEKI